jgi:hypothetical protein
MMRVQTSISKDSFPSGGSPINLEESFDEVQAMKSALSFLCRINADASAIKKFLTR